MQGIIMEEFVFKYNYQSKFCDVLGFSSSEEIKIYLNHTLIHTLYHSDTNDGNNWDGSYSQLFAFCLQHLGFKIVFNSQITHESIKNYSFYSKTKLKEINVNVILKNDAPHHFSYIVNGIEYFTETLNFDNLFSSVLEKFSNISFIQED